MISVYLSAVLIVVASLLAGRALLAVLGRREWTWLEGAVGLAALIVVSQVAIRAPGGGLAALGAVALLLALGGGYLLARAGFAGAPSRDERSAGPRLLAHGVPVVVIVLLVAAIPFALNARTGVLGEGIYSNDHAVHLYWAEWMQSGVGPQPKGIGWGYPVGPHALVAAVATGTGISIEAAFNGFLLAIPALTALTALSVLARLPAFRRTIGAVLVGIPYLAVSFLAQSAFKETAMALFLLAFAISLAALSGEGRERAAVAAAAAGEPGGRHADRALVVAIGVLAIGAVLTFSVPGLVWFGLGAAIWIAVELALGRLPFSPRAGLARLRHVWPLTVAALAGVAVLAALQAETISRFADRIGEVQESTGRLAGRLPPWEIFGVWPRGDFRVATAAVEHSGVAIALGAVVLAFGLVWWVRRRELAVPAVLGAAFVVVVASRLTSGIHVEAKALMVAAPLVMLVAVRALLDFGETDRRFAPPDGPAAAAKAALATLFVVAAAYSSFIALRAAPVGTSAHPAELAQLRDRVAGSEVVFLSLDRFAPYRLRGAERVQSPGGYVPSSLKTRPGKDWTQSEPIDFDSVPPPVLDRFDYAVTTAAAYQSSPPASFEPVARTDSFVLWKRTGKTPRREIPLGEDDGPGIVNSCAGEVPDGVGTAGVLPTPMRVGFESWEPSEEIVAGESARTQITLPPGRWQLALQYNSEVDLRVDAAGLKAKLPAALDGMYQFAPGRGPFWPVGAVESNGGSVDVRISAARPPKLDRLVGSERRVWLGDLAAIPADPASTAEPPGPPPAEEVALTASCGRYVDWYLLSR